MRFGLALIIFVLQLNAQLIPTGQPVPKTTNPPVVFLNGYQNTCGGGFADTFYTADQVLQANGIVSLFFDNCTVPNKPPIESLGNALGQFIKGLRYTDGTAVPQVDIVAHSMGGLIVRSYLAGMQGGSPATFTPPADPMIRRIVFLGTPHFGSTVAGFGFDQQASELQPGSQFLYDLNSWNQGTDDLRGLQAMSVSGNGGTGIESTIPGFDDGVVDITSSSLAFYRPTATRVLPYCHTSSVLLTTFGFCASNTPVLTNINTAPDNPVSQAIVSYLTGTSGWQSVGQAVEANTLASTHSGIVLQLRDANDTVQQITGVSVTQTGAPVSLSVNANTNAFSDTLTPGAATITATPSSGSAQTATVVLPATTEVTAVVKPGPMIFPKGVIPAVAQPPFPYDVAPGQYVAIYGLNLASSARALSQPYPTQVDDLQVLVNGAAAPIQYAGQGQINMIYPITATGLTKLTVKNAGGQQTLNVRVTPSMPAVFQLDSNGTAAALNGVTGVVVGPATPLHTGDFLSLYLTGLGVTDNRNGLDYARVQPTVTVGGQACPVSYAGRTPGVAGLDQINCRIPAGVQSPTAPVVVSAGGRQSGTVTVNVQ